MKGALCISIMTVFAACSKEPGPQFVMLEVAVTDEDARPVEDAEIMVAENSVGRTDKGGRLEARLSGPEGRRVQVQVACPDGRLAEDGASRDLEVRFLKKLDKAATSLAAVEARFKCVLKTRRVVVLVRADGVAGLPVRSLGHPIAHTNVDGVAQAVIEGVPGDEVEVTLDTTEKPELRPAMPGRRLTVPRQSQILVFDQKFERRAPKKRRAHKRARRRSGPRRI
ncbi:MAG: hypothetical protein GY854_05305 [Deltaproteobacteria bacterium]|nr:hypothetical protein [Deltaproteobacteria bacterium]